jgi:hypothetical protein
MTRRLAALAIALVASAIACGSPAWPAMTGPPPPTGTPTEACHSLTQDDRDYDQMLTSIIEDLQAAAIGYAEDDPACLRLLRQVESSLSHIEPPHYFTAFDYLLRQHLDLFIAAAEARLSGDSAQATDLFHQASTVWQQAGAEYDRLDTFLCE